MGLTVEDVRIALDGMSKTDAPDPELLRGMRRSGIVAAYCPDRTKVWVFGALKGEFRVNRGFALNREGVRPTESDDEPGFLRALRDQDRDDVGSVDLSFETNSPHEVFCVIDGDRMFSLGVILDLNNL